LGAELPARAAVFPQRRDYSAKAARDDAEGALRGVARIPSEHAMQARVNEAGVGTLGDTMIAKGEKENRG